jgi:hypothetical protein
MENLSLLKRGICGVSPVLRRDRGDSFDAAYSGPFTITSMTHTHHALVSNKPM